MQALGSEISASGVTPLAEDALTAVLNPETRPSQPSPSHPASLSLPPEKWAGGSSLQSVGISRESIRGPTGQGRQNFPPRPSAQCGEGLQLSIYRYFLGRKQVSEPHVCSRDGLSKDTQSHSNRLL